MVRMKDEQRTLCSSKFADRIGRPARCSIPDRNRNIGVFDHAGIPVH